MARKRRKVANCAYCGESRLTTLDHVPPQAIYTPRVPKEAPVAPICDACNAGTSVDDEYFRDSVLKYHRVADRPIVAPLLERMHRAAQLPAKRAYARQHVTALTTVPVTTTGGIYLGLRPATRINKTRIIRAATRYVTGLHFAVRGKRVAPGYTVQVGVEPERIHTDVDKVVKMLAGGPVVTIQDQVFTFACVSPQADLNISMWLLLFYGEFPVLGFVIPQDQARPV
jgi:hypothetical protein